MSFVSLAFILFFLIVLGGTVLLQRLPSNLPKQLFLLAASYYFYAWWDWRFCALLLFVTVSAYLTAKFAFKKTPFILGVVIPLGVLGIFKYFDFFLASFTGLFGRSPRFIGIILPVGISFYTFQALSYVIDVRRGKLAAETDFVRLALYISFFPQLVAGPIIKATDFLPQLRENRRVTANGVRFGLQLIIFGLAKKIVLADHLSVFVDDVFFAPSAYHFMTLILAVISYSLQIYFDFSGYSDIAIGVAKCFGYDFLPNFNLPYLSQSVTEFWHRWHISLSTWLREYLYIPLGGNRRGKARQIFNLFVTMLLGGLWHGANWTFIFWGALNGLTLCVDKLFRRQEPKSVFGRTVSVLLTYLFISFTWIFFRADSFPTAWCFLQGIFTLQNGIVQHYFWAYVSIAAVLIATFCAVRRGRKNGDSVISGFYPTVDLRTYPGLTVFFTVCGLILVLAFTGENPFVYFQF